MNASDVWHLEQNELNICELLFRCDTATNQMPHSHFSIRHEWKQQYIIWGRNSFSVLIHPQRQDIRLIYFVMLFRVQNPVISTVLKPHLHGKVGSEDAFAFFIRKVSS